MSAGRNHSHARASFNRAFAIAIGAFNAYD